MIDGELRSVAARLAVLDDMVLLNDAMYEVMPLIVGDGQQAALERIQVRAHYFESVLCTGALADDPVLPALLARHEIEHRLWQGCGDYLRALPGLEAVGEAAIRAMVLGIATPFVNLLALHKLIPKEPMVWGGSKDDKQELRDDYLREECNTVFLVHPKLKEVDHGEAPDPLYLLMLCAINYTQSWFYKTPCIPSKILERFSNQCDGNYENWFMEVVYRGDDASGWGAALTAHGMRYVSVFIEPEMWTNHQVKEVDPLVLLAQEEAERAAQDYGPIIHYGEQELALWWKYGIAVIGIRDPSGALSFEQSRVFRGQAAGYDVHHGMFVTENEEGTALLYFDAME